MINNLMDTYNEYEQFNIDTDFIDKLNNKNCVYLPNINPDYIYIFIPFIENQNIIAVKFTNIDTITIKLNSSIITNKINDIYYKIYNISYFNFDIISNIRCNIIGSKIINFNKKLLHCELQDVTLPYLIYLPLNIAIPINKNNDTNIEISYDAYTITTNNKIRQFILYKATCNMINKANIHIYYGILNN